ncbi:MAG: efflux RND transporter periplasmic adaptor subunit [Thermodesulfobacteriota bacterium]|nr:efflux RND transporter periplasmic adaptor subunit [Thermodesulfobacteriota bacterium]
MTEGISEKGLEENKATLSTSSRKNKIGKALRFLLAMFIFFAACAVSFFFLTHKPRAGHRQVTYTAPLAETMVVNIRDHDVKIMAKGTVVPSRKVDLSSRVMGEIIKTSPEYMPGGKFKSGEEILRLDPIDYELALRRKESEVIHAGYELKMEIGRQIIAKKEYQLFGEKLQKQDRELVLREPHLKAAQAALAAAESSLQQAKLDLKRTKVFAPFNAIVQSKHADIGSYVTAGMKLVTLVDTNQYWIEVALPIDRIRWISIPDTNSNKGSPARIMHKAGWGSSAFRAGIVRRLKTEVEPEGRMARLVVAVEDPLCIKSANKNNPKLMLGVYVSVEIKGRKLKEAACIPRSALRDGSKVWVMQKDNSLDIRGIDIVWSEHNSVYIKNSLKNGEKIITSDLAAPVHGMQLRSVSNGKTPDLSQPDRINHSERVKGS